MRRQPDHDQLFIVSNIINLITLTLKQLSAFYGSHEISQMNWWSNLKEWLTLKGVESPYRHLFAFFSWLFSPKKVMDNIVCTGFILTAEETKKIFTKLSYAFQSYFLNVCLSRVMPSSVFITASLRASMHLFSRGSPVRSPVSLRAYKLNSVINASKCS